MIKRVIDARLHLLDRQVLDRNGIPISTVADLELTDVPFEQELTGSEPAPVIVNLLSGPVLATRVFGGRPPSSRWYRIPWNAITEIGVAVDLAVEGDTLDVTWVERWIRDRVIGRIPGGSGKRSASDRPDVRAERTEGGDT
ncbi:MAG TPA: hypothetical protein VN133_13885 [Humibacter sp.]|nr:hypothetical protein [Humibacter sp.]